VLRLLFAGLFTLRGILTLLGLVALAVLIWFLGPYLAYGDFAPLRDEYPRILTIIGVFVVFIAVTLVRRYLAWRANRRLINSLLESEALGAIADNRGADELEVIRERFEAAMRALRDASVGRGAAGDSQSYLAELPWYMIIGPPGAGKTTILKNSGLQFPLAERLGAESIAGVGGTRNCDWWFADQAVLVDTAGRYTMQDVNAEVDKAAWRGFLDLLKTHRRRRPINGVLLAISLSDVLADGKRHIETLRRRLQEMMKTFGMQLPVYLLITKCDLIAGFTEYFDDLAEEGRRQVWGVTLPLGEVDKNFVESFGAELGKLSQNLDDGLLARMTTEQNLARRAAMFSFPKEFSNLSASIAAFAYEVFRPNKYEMASLLRGVYFTSGTQEGTPIDRLIAAMGRNFGLQGAARPPFSGRGKAYFIHRLLTEVIFPEQGLAGADRKLERDLALLHSFGYAAAIAAVVALCGLWYGALARSQARIGDTTAAASAVTARLGEVKRPATFANLLPVMDLAVGLKSAAGDGSLLAWLDGFGLSATQTLAPEAQGAYDRVLLSYLLPTFADRVADRLRAGLNAARPGELSGLREALKVYLMLGDSEHFDRNQVIEAAHAELPLAFPLDPSRRAALSTHLDRLMTLLPHPIPIDRGLVAEARARLTREPPVEQIYARLLREASQDPRLRQVDIAKVIDTTSLQISVPRGSGARSTVDGIYTREGFYNFVIPRLPVIVREEEGSDWVLAADRGDDAASQRLTRQVAERYVQDYIAAWQGALGSVAAISFTDLQRGLSVLQGLADPQSPVSRFVDLVKENTDLPPPGGDDSNKSANAPVATASLLPSVAGLAGKATAAAVSTALGDMPWPGKLIAAPFQPLLQFTAGGGPGQPVPIDKMHENFGKLFNAMSGIANAPDPRQAAYQVLGARIKDPTTDVFGALRAQSAQSPPPVRAIMRDVTNSSWSILLSLSYDYVNDAWRREIVPICAGALSDRYPLVGDAKDDVTLRDFGDFFRPGGIIDEFFTKYLAPLVVDQRNGYAPAKVDGVAAPIKLDSLAQFQRARTIRQAFFPTSGQAPAVKFSLRPTFLSAEVLSAALRDDQQEIVYRHEPPRAVDLDWPTRSESSVVSVTLTLLDGTQKKVEQSGQWALFRIIDAAHLSTAGGADRYAFTIGPDDGPHVSYELRAGGVNNPFSLAALRAFRCPDSL
jgi:type VI secretion system protein ImpL